MITPKIGQRWFWRWYNNEEIVEIIERLNYEKELYTVKTILKMDNPKAFVPNSIYDVGKDRMLGLENYDYEKWKYLPGQDKVENVI